VPNTKLEDTLALLSNFADVKGIDVSGSFSSKLNIKGMPQKIDSLKTDTEISLNKIALTHDNIPVRLEGIAKLQTTSDNVQIEKVDLKVLDIPVVINGEAKNLRKSPYVDITVTVPRVKATELQKAVAPFSKLIGIGTSGALEANLNVKGSPDTLSEMTATGDVSFEKISVKYQDIDAMLDGGVKLKDNVMNIDLNATYAQNTASLKGSVKNLFKNQDITLNVYSQRLNLDRLIPAPADKEKPAAAPESPGPEKPLKEADPLDLTLAARGEIKIDEAVYKGLNMNDFLLNYEFKNNKLTISTLKGKAGKGAFDLKPFVDLSKPGYTYNLSGNIDSLYIEEIINAFFPKAKDKAFGIISANLKMNGSGTLPESMKKNLVASADITMREGKITNMPILSNLAMLFNAKELETIHVRQGSGTMSANNGRARLDILITSDDVKMDPKGNIGLLDEDLDLAFDLKLSPRLKGKAMSSSYSEYLSDEAGWGRIPVKCPGSLSKPKCTPDIAKAGTRAVEKELDKQIDKIFKKKEGEESPETEAVKGLLKGILGK
jgi:AsmA protein